MKRFAILAVFLAFAAAACDDSPTSPSTNPNVAKFTAILLPGNEVPAVTNADRSASGVVQITMNLTRDTAGALTGVTGDFIMHVTGFPANTVLTGAHIHNAPAGVNATVSFNTGLASGEFTLPTGQMSITKTGAAPTSIAIVQAILDNPGGAYFNVHTTVNPGGAIRGQLVRSN
jgi:CHRD domain-containing protein